MSIKTDIAQGLALLPTKMDSLAARVMLRAINLQENPKRLEQQVGGPARGDYQFENGGGVKGVMTHPSVKDLASKACAARGVAFNRDSVYHAIGTDRILAAALARLLLWTDPGRLPQVGEAVAAWHLYLSVWRPGAYAREGDALMQKFIKNYGQAVQEYTP